MNSIVLEEVGDFLSLHSESIKTLSDEWRSYYSGTVNYLSIIYWLAQFGGIQQVTSAFRLIQKIKFIDSNKMAYMMAEARKKIPEEIMQNPIFCQVGKPYDSSGVISYQYSKDSDDNESSLNSLWHNTDSLGQAILKQNPSSVIFLDDNITSGIQFKQFLNELIFAHKTPFEYVTKPLTTEEVDAIKKIPIILMVCVDLCERDKYDKEIQEHFGFLSFKVFSGLKDFVCAYNYTSTFWPNEISVKQFSEYSINLANDLYRDKGWEQEKINDRALGYGNLGRLVVFSHNIPKSLPPMFWKYGVVDGKSWIPLFPERREWAKHKENITQPDPYLLYFSQSIASGNFSGRSPICVPKIITSDGDGEKAVVSLSNMAIVGLSIQKLSQKIQEIDLIDLPDLQPGRPYVPPTLGPSRESQEEYNKQVKEYNSGLPLYSIAITHTLNTLANAFQVDMRVINDGNAPAHEVILRLELPDTIGFLDDLPKFPELPEAPEPPRKLTDIALRVPGGITNHWIKQLSAMNSSKNKKSYIKLSKHGGKRFLSIYFGKVLQYTFRDRQIKYLIRQTQGVDEINFSYNLIYEESNRPIEGSFLINFNNAGQFHPEAANIILEELES